MNRKLSASLVIASLGLIAAAPVLAQINTPDTGSQMRNDRTEFRADLQAPGSLMGGNARYRAESRRNLVRARLDIEIEDAEPDTTYTVAVNGKAIGSITTNGLGTGEISFRSPSDDPSHLPNVPTIVAGDSVSVGPASGVMN